MEKKNIIIAVLVLLVGLVIAIVLLTGESKVEKYESCVESKTRAYDSQMQPASFLCDTSRGDFVWSVCEKKINMRKEKVAEIKDECAKMYLN